MSMLLKGILAKCFITQHTELNWLTVKSKTEVLSYPCCTLGFH
jgi:hypothetical protein